jgi:hypothetical protein
MRKFVRSSVAAATLSSLWLLSTGAFAPARAADIPVKAPVVAVPAWTWTGLYGGLHGGYGWGRSQTDVNSATATRKSDHMHVDGGLASLLVC